MQARLASYRLELCAPDLLDQLELSAFSLFFSRKAFIVSSVICYFALDALTLFQPGQLLPRDENKSEIFTSTHTFFPFALCKE
jgi:hypothetical protein